MDIQWKYENTLKEGSPAPDPTLLKGLQGSLPFPLLAHSGLISQPLFSVGNAPDLNWS